MESISRNRTESLTSELVYSRLELMPIQIADILESNTNEYFLVCQNENYKLFFVDLQTGDLWEKEDLYSKQFRVLPLGHAIKLEVHN